MRLLTGALAGESFRATLVGDESLTRRPMRRLLPTLAALGASVELTDEGTAPIRVGGSRLTGASVTTEFASAQVRSAFELAAIRAVGASEIDGPPGFRDHTERWLTALGLGSRPTPTRFRIEPGEVPAARYDIPGDPSSAAFLWASAALVPGAIVATPDVSLNPGRIGFLTILEAMGAKITAGVTGAIHGDPVGTVVVEGDELGSAEVSGDLVAAAIDELPLVAVLGAYGTGITVVRDAAELRAKESDRIAATVDLIRSLGGGAEASSDGFQIVGTGGLEAGVVDSRGDHRIAMTAAVAATAATGPVTVRGASVAAVSWPSFYDDLEAMWSSR
jgi:3-phosphoshikimate 1-carboxyvinyltransferase